MVKRKASRQNPKHRQIADALTDMVSRGEFGPGARLPTESELSKRFGVSNITIRQAKQILARSGVLVSVRKKGTFVLEQALLPRVALLWEAARVIESGGLQIIARVLEDQCRGQMVFRHFAAWSGVELDGAGLDRFMNDVVEFRPSAMLVMGKLRQIEERCRHEGIPLIAMHGRTGIPFVGIDTLAFATMGIEYLWNHGVKDIAVMALAAGYYDDLRKRYKADWPWSWFANPDAASQLAGKSEEFGHDAFRRIWQLHRRPKGLLVLDDLMFKGAILAMAELGVKPGRDITLVSLVNTKSPIYLPTEFVKLEIDTEQYAATLAKMIRQVVARPGEVPSPTLIKPRLVI